MKGRKIYAVDSTTSVVQAELTSNNKVIDLVEFIPQGFRGKLILNFEELDHLDESFVSIKDSRSLLLEENVCSDLIFNFKTNDNKINNFYDELLSISISSGKSLYIFSSIDIPYIAKDHVPESKRGYVEMSKVFNLYVIISNKKSDNNKNGVVKNNLEVFDAYGELGFVIVDVGSFDDFISTRVRSNNLVEEFTTTEIANEIFDEGLMILSWGHIPWVYYINSSGCKDIDLLIGQYTGYCGIYKFKHSTGKYSVIPGNELQDWDACKNKVWPLIKINGNGDYVQVKLYVKNALSQTDSDYPIPTFYLQRIGNESRKVEALLQSNIFGN